MTNNTQLSPMDLMRTTLEKMQSEFAKTLPKEIDPEKFVRTTLTTIQMNPDLLNADRKSLIGTCMKAAQDGLLLDGREAAAVTFNSKAGKMVQYMPMVGGLFKKIRNSGEIASISANVAYSNDLFEYELGDEERIIHKPVLTADRGTPIAVYAVAKTKDGAIYREVMGVAEVEKIRATSKTGKFGPWVDWWDEMAKKTVIRRIAKRLPSSADSDKIIKSDLRESGFEQRPIVNITPEPQEPAEKASRLKQSLSQHISANEFVDDETGEVFELAEGPDESAPELNND